MLENAALYAKNYYGKLEKQLNFNFRQRKMEEKKIVRLTETVQSAG